MPRELTIEEMDRDANEGDRRQHDDMECECGAYEPREKTPFEKEIDAAAFNPRAFVEEVLAHQPLEAAFISYREPINVVCGICGAKHCGGHR